MRFVARTKYFILLFYYYINTRHKKLNNRATWKKNLHVNRKEKKNSFILQLIHTQLKQLNSVFLSFCRQKNGWRCYERVWGRSSVPEEIWAGASGGSDTSLWHEEGMLRSRSWGGVREGFHHQPWGWQSHRPDWEGEGEWICEVAGCLSSADFSPLNDRYKMTT